MLKKRIVGVITVKQGWAVQSAGFRHYLPLGRPEWLAENLDRWGADEILVSCIDRSRAGSGPDFELLRRLGALGLSTPLVYGGGIRDVSDARAVIQCGADRLCVDALLRADPAAVRSIAEQVGAQAVIGAMPVTMTDGKPQWLDYLTGAGGALSDATRTLFDDGVVSEALIIDWKNEGRPRGFDARLTDCLPCPSVPVIAFGGVSDPQQAGTLLAQERVAAVAVGNFLAYREHAIQHIKQQLTNRTIRSGLYLQD